ncbi:hypothetical protein PENDEC_c016G01453 [Penicillium decumbens]|uniref:Uncharacterized protein n=1 Tax=Penicillium decumbens TaxID=69771 RepID=A0A1V6P914_PENDC|nr:hypothetical protein PENDEC_c016G01453 [Penicillium decumbens]
MGFASKLAAIQSQNPNPNQSQNQTMSNTGSYQGAPPAGYTGGPPAALQPGGSQQPQQYQAYPGSPPPQGSVSYPS